MAMVKRVALTSGRGTWEREAGRGRGGMRDGCGKSDVFTRENNVKIGLG